MSVSAVFLDRDGVLNVYLPGDYVRRPEELTLLPGVGEAVRALQGAGYRVFVISNQQGVAKGLMSPEDLSLVDRALQAGLAVAGGKLDGSYYCPHRQGECDCRKPLPGLILKAAREHGLDLSASVFIGDTETDALAARAAGVGRFFLVLTGKHSAEAAQNRALFPVPPDGVFPNLPLAVEALLGGNVPPGF